ncbi:hypothetical protein KAR91_49330 [Candidatus Pacearchaeota archaeon]|nr:hypothetical protein [Candidatus Pacearchaeota archaeon]
MENIYATVRFHTWSFAGGARQVIGGDGRIEGMTKSGGRQRNDEGKVSWGQRATRQPRNIARCSMTPTIFNITTGVKL